MTTSCWLYLSNGSFPFSPPGSRHGHLTPGGFLAGLPAPRLPAALLLFSTRQPQLSSQTCQWDQLAPLFKVSEALHHTQNGIERVPTSHEALLPLDLFPHDAEVLQTSQRFPSPPSSSCLRCFSLFPLSRMFFPWPFPWLAPTYSLVSAQEVTSSRNPFPTTFPE